MSAIFFLRRGSSSSIFKPSNCTIIRFLCTPKNNNYVSGSDPLPGSLVVPSQYWVRELPYGHPVESNNPEEWPYIRAKPDPEYIDEHDYMPPDELYEKYYAAWKHYILESKSNHHLSLPLSKILLRTLHEYMDDSPNKVYDNTPTNNFEPWIDGPIAVLDGCRYFSLKEQNISLFNGFRTPPRSHRSSWRHWLIIYYDKREEKQQPCQPWRGMTRLLCPFSRTPAYLPQPDSITCHLSSPFLADIKKKKKDGSRLVLRRFAITSPSSPPWASIVMAIDKSCGYLVYTSHGSVNRERPDCWIVLDSITNYATGDLLYLKKDDNFYVLPDAQSGHVEVWSFQNRLLSKTSEMRAELSHNNDNSYHHIHSYLVESLNGNLLLVRRYVEQVNDYRSSFKTHSFEVFELNLYSKRWEAVPSLGNDEALFVGSNSSFALSSTKYPEVIPNCIYFTDQLCDHGAEENMIHGKDNGIFHLKDCTVTPLFSREWCDHAPTWLCPSDEWWPQHYRCLGFIGYGKDY